jgi:hypothetical protein
MARAIRGRAPAWSAGGADHRRRNDDITAGAAVLEVVSTAASSPGSASAGWRSARVTKGPAVAPGPRMSGQPPPADGRPSKRPPASGGVNRAHRSASRGEAPPQAQVSSLAAVTPGIRPSNDIRQPSGNGTTRAACRCRATALFHKDPPPVRAPSVDRRSERSAASMAVKRGVAGRAARCSDAGAPPGGRRGP